jgi:hypothetical protein
LRNHNSAQQGKMLMQSQTLAPLRISLPLRKQEGTLRLRISLPLKLNISLRQP